MLKKLRVAFFLQALRQIINHMEGTGTFADEIQKSLGKGKIHDRFLLVFS